MKQQNNYYLKVIIATFLTIGTVSFMLLLNQDNNLLAQVPISATPDTVILPSPTPIITPQSVATATQTFTPQAEIPIRLEVLEAYGTTDVYFNANSDSEKVGTIGVGEQYIVLGRYFSWIQIEFDPSPDGTGWVFNEYVSVDGDLFTVRDFTIEQPTADPLVDGATQTWQAIELTPGGFLTVTANARIIDAPSSNQDVELDNNNMADLPSGVVLPTFTYPPNIIAQVPTEQSPLIETIPPPPENSTSSGEGGIAPIIPILVLGGLGVAGLLMSVVRR